MNSIMISIIIITITIIIILLIIGNFFFNLALNSKTSKSFLDEDGNSNDKSKKRTILKWAESKYEQINIKSFDNLKLNAYYYNNHKNNHKYAILVHGYNGKALDMVYSAKYFYEEGYTVLSPDCRGLGESEGNYIGMGWHDRLDILKWINLIISKDPNAEIILYGVSMGGATVMMVSGENLPKNVKVIIEDCGYTDAIDIFTYQIKSLFNLPKFPIIHMASLITKLRAGFLFSEASSIKQLEKNITPILFIHGDIDDFVPFSMLNKVYNATNSEKEKYVVKGAGHGLSAIVDRDIYWDNVFNFINKYIKN